MNKTQFTLAALCAALLTACGGGSGGDYNFISKTGNAGGKDAKPANPQDIYPTGGVFLVDTTSKIGQANSPSATLLSGGRLVFNQNRIVNEVCPYDSSTCSSPALEREKERLKKDIEKLKTPPEQANASQTGAAQSGAQQGGSQNTSGGQANPAPKLSPAAEAEIAKKELELEILERRTKQGVPAIRTYGNQILTSAGRVDRRDGQAARELALEVTDINIGDNAGGVVHNDFSEVSVYGELESNEIIYAHHPSLTGWNYQTFATNRSSKEFQEIANGNPNRKNISYQSFGVITVDMPKRGGATYNGIAQAYYNGNPVTMHNRLDVDYLDKFVSYKTTDVPVLHKLDSNNNHIAEYRPELALTGKAAWAGENKIAGSMQSANGLTGRIEGQFYGPKAEEIGGVFGVAGKINGTWYDYFGGYGAKK